MAGVPRCMGGEGIYENSNKSILKNVVDHSEPVQVSIMAFSYGPPPCFETSGAITFGFKRHLLSGCGSILIIL